jgi:hypothetical protein
MEGQAPTRREGFAQAAAVPSATTSTRRWLRPLLWLATLVPLAANAQVDFHLFQVLEPSLFKVEAANGDGSVSIGTAVAVGRGVVATNCHVTQRARSIALVRGGERQTVESEYSDIDHDLCLLYAPQAESAPVVAIGEQPPRAGQAVFSVGFFLGVAPRVSIGEINAVYEYEGSRVIETTAAFGSGASGGGLFDADGHLVGIVTFMTMGPEMRHFCLPARWVSEALARFVGRPVAPLSGNSFWQRPAVEQPYFLRVVSLETRGNWTEMAELSRQWAQREADNPSSWYALGKAYGQLHESGSSIDAYRTAVRVEADFAPAWLALGTAYADSCRQAEVAQVHTRLASLDRQLAEDLAMHRVYCPDETAERQLP